MVPRVNPLEVRARREALGLSQGLLASLLGVAQATVSNWEAGKRAIPEGLSEDLAVQEEIVEDLVDLATELLDAAEGDPVSLAVYATDGELWESHPEMVGVPSVLHRVAMARARAMADGPCTLGVTA